jgi:predicted nucleotidyltransferase
MEESSHIEELFGTKSRIAVMRVLYHAMQPMSISEISRRAGITRPSALDALRGFDWMQVVRCTHTAGAKLYALNRQSVITRQYVLPLFDAESNLLHRIIDDIQVKFEDFAESVILFGSFARGDYSSRSDIDVMLVVKDEERKRLVRNLTSDYFSYFHDRYGAECLPMVYTEDEVRHLFKDSSSFINNVAEDGIVVTGKDIKEWAS